MTEHVSEPQKTELIVEQSDLDKVFSFPVFEQITNVDSNITELLVEFKKLNEYLIPTEEEQIAMQSQAAESSSEPIEPEPEQQPEPDSINYDELILEQLELMNTQLESSIEVQNDLKVVTAESSILLTVAVVSAIGVKVLIEQMTKW
jgi:hypothetical protein